MVQPLPAGSRATWQADHQINDLLTDENLDMVERLRGVADELGTNLPVLSMAWILQHPEISCVIARASKPGQLENNLKASGFQIPPTPWPRSTASPASTASSATSADVIGLPRWLVPAREADPGERVRE